MQSYEGVLSQYPFLINSTGSVREVITTKQKGTVAISGRRDVRAKGVMCDANLCRDYEGLSYAYSHKGLETGTREDSVYYHTLTLGHLRVVKKESPSLTA